MSTARHRDCGNLKTWKRPRPARSRSLTPAPSTSRSPTARAKAYAIAAQIREAASAVRQDKKAIAQGFGGKYREERIAKNEAKIAELEPAHEAARQEAAFADVALYKGWQRFFLVEHIHGSQHCSSFRPTTQIGWLTSVSGLTEAEAVAEYGPRLCTICFPTAPVAWTQASADPDVCEGSGKYYDREKRTGREGAYYSPSGYCATCGQVVGLASRGSIKIRKHKKPEAALARAHRSREIGHR